LKIGEWLYCIGDRDLLILECEREADL